MGMLWGIFAITILTTAAYMISFSITPVPAAAMLTNGAALTSVYLIGAGLAAAAAPLILLDRTTVQRRSREMRRSGVLVTGRSQTEPRQT
ncbi:hypothetical protein [Nocardia sp. NPDC052566]|uniref:hypothetical protein n=1 Tax=Nocardia sp. NPDC052566 TaxID=3364330 RepID=UPI0037CAFC91